MVHGWSRKPLGGGVLHGTLDTLDLGDVLVLLEMGKKTGALEVESDDGRGVLFLVEGRFAGSGADEADPHPSSSSQFEAELVDACAALLGLERGNFRFLDGRTPTDIPRDTLPISPILADAKQAAAEWRAVAASIPSLDAPVLLVPELPADEIVLDRRSWRVLALVDGSRSVRDLARDLARNMADVGRTIAELSGRGVVAFFEAPTDPVLIAGEPAGPTQWTTAAAANESMASARGSQLEAAAIAEPATGTWAEPATGTAWSDAHETASASGSTAEPEPADGLVAEGGGGGARAPRSVSELAAWSDVPDTSASDPYAPAPPAATHNGYDHAAFDPAAAPIPTSEADLPDPETSGGAPTPAVFGRVDSARDGSVDDAADDDMRRDRGALLRMFSALKE